MFNLLILLIDKVKDLVSETVNSLKDYRIKRIINREALLFEEGMCIYLSWDISKHLLEESYLAFSRNELARIMDNFIGRIDTICSKLNKRIVYIYIYVGDDKQLMIKCQHGNVEWKVYSRYQEGSPKDITKSVILSLNELYELKENLTIELIEFNKHLRG